MVSAQLCTPLEARLNHSHWRNGCHQTYHNASISAYLAHPSVLFSVCQCWRCNWGLALDKGIEHGSRPLGLQPSVNGPGPSPGCPSPSAGYGPDTPVSANPPGPPQENMANPKEKTPMCLVNELARFNRVQPQYKLLNERGPAHAKIFTVQLCLGEQVWEAEGTSIKKAQHSTASLALSESLLPRPAPRSPTVDINSNPGSITPTVELNGLAMKRGEPAIYRPLDPKPVPNYRANYNFRGMFNQRYHYPVPKIFYVQLSVGTNEFIGEGRTRQAARHNAAMKALQALRNEPIPERPPQSPEEQKEVDEGSSRALRRQMRCYVLLF
ncbi:hypothetical protein J4Q44_G00367890 [Coregonus suidteri]|uniref:DRBM domain-containing protein n=1 Tax=Coregonus suidteri TaxID=861788 RepID=A0AAN8KKM4_9TELE